jgi:hypothetical protein
MPKQSVKEKRTRRRRRCFSVVLLLHQYNLGDGISFLPAATFKQSLSACSGGPTSSKELESVLSASKEKSLGFICQMSV